MLRVPEQSTHTQHCVCRARPVRTMNHLTRHDYARALQLLAQVEAQADDAEVFARAVVLALQGYMAAERATLSVCDLATGRHQVVGLPGTCPGGGVPPRFDWNLGEPLRVRHPGIEGAGLTRRIPYRGGRNDSQRNTLYGDGERRTGLEYTITVPLFLSPQTQVSVVLGRHGRDFDAHDRARLNLLCPHLDFLYRHACRAAAALPGTALLAPLPGGPPSAPCSFGGLTLREGQVMHWLAGGKTDAEIAALLSISPRTVQKHLEHVYVKLGVETRTAAVMRTHASQSWV